MTYHTNSLDNKIIELLKSGAVGLLPSDTIYGISARALDRQAVERIHKLKGREGHKPLIVLISDIEQLVMLGLNHKHADHVKKYWPGALSIEFDAKNAPGWLHRGGFHFAVRMPDFSELRELIRKVGPIVSTSANLQGQPPAQSVAEAKKYFNELLDFYVDAGGLSGQPSTLVQIVEDKLQVVRQGAVTIR